MNPQAAPAPKVDPKAFRELKRFKYSSPFLACRFDPRGRFVFAAAQDFSIQRWELTSGKQVGYQGGHDSWVRALGFDAQGRWLLSGGYDGRLVWWPAGAEKPEPLRKIDAHQGWIRALAVSPNGQLVATVGNDHLVKLWKVEDGSPVAELAGHKHHVYNVIFHPNGQELVTCDHHGVVKHWSVKDQKELRELKAPDLHKYDGSFRAHIGGARSMAFDTQGKLLALGGITNVTNAFAGVGNPCVVLLDWESGKKKLLYKPANNRRGTTWGLAYHPSGFWMAVSGGSGGWAFFYQGEKTDPLHQVKLPTTAQDLALHPGLVQAGICFYDRHVRIYTLEPKQSKT